MHMEMSAICANPNSVLGKSLSDDASDVGMADPDESSEDVGWRPMV